jgi:hypothetical protein
LYISLSIECRSYIWDSELNNYKLLKNIFYDEIKFIKIDKFILWFEGNLIKNNLISKFNDKITNF